MIGIRINYYDENKLIQTCHKEIDDKDYLFLESNASVKNNIAKEICQSGFWLNHQTFVSHNRVTKIEFIKL